MAIEIKKDYSSDRIELRSEKVRDTSSVRFLRCWYVEVSPLSQSFFILMLVVFLVPYPYGKGETIFQHLFFLQKGI